MLTQVRTGECRRLQHLEAKWAWGVDVSWRKLWVFNLILNLAFYVTIYVNRNGSCLLYQLVVEQLNSYNNTILFIIFNCKFLTPWEILKKVYLYLIYSTFVALAPTSAKLTTQYLVLDHMTNHYSKITKAKCKKN